MEDHRRFDRALTDLHKLNASRKYTDALGPERKASLERALAELFKISESIVEEKRKPSKPTEAL